MSGAFRLPAARPWGRAPRARRPCFPGAGAVGVGTQHRPHSVRSCGPALRAVGVAGGRSRGGCLAPLSGASEVRRLSSPGCPPSGRAVRVCGPRAVSAGVRAWGPGTVPLACMPCGGLRAAGVVGGLPGGVASHRCKGRLVSGAVPLLAARPWGRAARAPLPVFPGRGWCGRGSPALAPQRVLLPAGIARCGGGGRASPGGGGGTVVRGRLGSGARPPLAACPWGG